MKWKILLALVAALSLMASGASADIVQGTGGATFQSYPADSQQNGQPYWDGNSSDSDLSATVGNFLTKTNYFAGYANSPNLTNPQWWGNAMPPGAGLTGAADPNMSFLSTGAGHTVTMRVEVAGMANTNSFGWYQVPAVGNPVLNQLFSGSQGAGATANFVVNVNTSYGFYLGVDTKGIFDKWGNPIIDTYYFMDAAFNSSTVNSTTADIGNQHFAIFRPSNSADLLLYPNSFWIGAEDLPITSGDKDFQDMIVRLDPSGAGSQVPLPPSALLLGSGLLGLLILRRSKR